MEWLLGIISGIFLILSLLTLYRRYSILTSYNPAIPDTNQERPLSIVLCTHGLAPRLMNYIEKILSQNYSQFEVIVVCKNTPIEIFESLQTLYALHSRLKIFDITNKDCPYLEKKQALHVGISLTKYDWIVTIDDDCYPQSENWLKSISQHLAHNESDILLGFSPYISQPSLLNQWIRFDALQVAINYAYYTLIEEPYMGVGRNMVFRKGLWSQDYLKVYETKGSGDDTTLVQYYKETKKIGIFMSPLVYSFPHVNFSSWIKQKIRHINKGNQMDFFLKITLAKPLLYGVLFWLFIWIWLSYFAFHFVIFYLLFIYLGAKTYFYFQISKHIQWKLKPSFFTCIFDAPHNLCLVLLPFFSIFIKNKWRE